MNEKSFEYGKIKLLIQKYPDTGGRSLVTLRTLRVCDGDDDDNDVIKIYSGCQSVLKLSPAEDTVHAFSSKSKYEKLAGGLGLSSIKDLTRV